MKQEPSYDSEEDDGDFEDVQSPDDDDVSSDKDFSEEKPKKKKQKKEPVRLPKKRRNNDPVDVKKFLDMEAEDSDDSHEDLKGDKKDQYYDPSALQKRNQFRLNDIEQKYKEIEAM